MATLPEIMCRLNLLALKYLDLNMNQIEWDEDWVRKQGYVIIRKHRDKRVVGGSGDGGEEG